ncbi:MAG: hypothetical protein ACRCTJ_00575, partial [Brevinema sp.]
MQEKNNHSEYTKYLKAHFEKLLIEREFYVVFVDSGNNEIIDEEFNKSFDDYLYFLILMLYFEIPSF